MRIDAHQHFWKLDRGDYGWLTPSLQPLYRDFLPDDLKPWLQKLHIERTVVVQAAPTVEETDYLLKLYEETAFIAGVVGWLDLESPDFPEMFAAYRQRRGFLGIRPMLQDLEDDRWIVRPQVLKHLELLVEEDFPIDILVKPRHLPHIIELLQHFPTLRAVIDHLAKPHIAERILEPWKEQIQAISTFPNVMCKCSGMITEADPVHWKTEDLWPFIQHVLNSFGTNRIIFGSDWPVCLLAGTYEEVYEALNRNLCGIEETDAANIFGGNAIRFYKIIT